MTKDQLTTTINRAKEQGLTIRRVLLNSRDYTDFRIIQRGMLDALADHADGHVQRILDDPTYLLPSKFLDVPIVRAPQRKQSVLEIETDDLTYTVLSEDGSRFERKTRIQDQIIACRLSGLEIARIRISNTPEFMHMKLFSRALGDHQRRKMSFTLDGVRVCFLRNKVKASSIEILIK